MRLVICAVVLSMVSSPVLAETFQEEEGESKPDEPRDVVFSLGVGASSHHRFYRGWVRDLHTGIRIAAPYWISVSFGFADRHDEDFEEPDWQEAARYHEGTVAGGRAWCPQGSLGLCFAAAGGFGYQRVEREHGERGQLRMFEETAVFAHARTALRVNLENMIWLDLSLSLRTPLRDEQSAYDGNRLVSILGVAVHVTP